MKKLLSYRLKGGILPLVLAISLIMASLCSIVLMLAYYHMQYKTILSIRSKLQRNLDSAIALSMASPEQLPLDDWMWLDLYGEGVDSVGILRSYWGVYELVQIKAVQGSHHLSKAILLGTMPSLTAPALYLADGRRSIKLAGDALIKGDAYLPEAGIKAGYIDRFGYNKTQMVYGKVIQSEPRLPELDQGYEKSLTRLLGSVSSTPVMPLDSMAEQLFVSYANSQVVGFYSAAAIRIKNGQKLGGKVVLRSDKLIVVSQGAHLEGTILLAPIIVIETGFRGSVQAFATDSLVLQENVHLLYPSAVGLLQKKEEAMVALFAGVRLEGLLLLLSNQQYKRKGFVKLHKGSQVVGSIYVNGFLQHEGIVAGNVYAQKLFVKTRYSSEEDYLYNGHIDRGALPSEYVGSSILPVKGKRKIIEWLE